MLIEYIDPIVQNLKNDLTKFENLLTQLSSEKTELEKQIQQFHLHYVNELGELTAEILKYKKLLLRDSPNQEAYQEAENQEQQYNEYFSNTKIKQTQQNELLPEEQIILKKLYRQAVNICHPDKVSEELKEQANSIFMDLQKAYEKNNLQTVQQILRKLQNNDFLIPKAKTLNNKEQILSAIFLIKEKIKKLKLEIKYLKKSEIYKTYTSIKNIEDYFNNKKIELKNKLQQLKNQYNVSK